MHGMGVQAETLRGSRIGDQRRGSGLGDQRSGSELGEQGRRSGLGDQRRRSGLGLGSVSVPLKRFIHGTTGLLDLSRSVSPLLPPLSPHAFRSSSSPPEVTLFFFFLFFPR